MYCMHILYTHSRTHARRALNQETMPGYRTACLLALFFFLSNLHMKREGYIPWGFFLGASVPNFLLIGNFLLPAQKRLSFKSRLNEYSKSHGVGLLFCLSVCSHPPGGGTFAIRWLCLSFFFCSPRLSKHFSVRAGGSLHLPYCKAELFYKVKHFSFRKSNNNIAFTSL